jgi:hypothetical protein
VIGKLLKETGWVVGTLVKVFLPTAAVGFAVCMPLWFASGDVALVVAFSLVVGAFGWGVWYLRYFEQIRERAHRARPGASSPRA